MEPKYRIVTVTADNVDQERFFCYKSKPKSKGYLAKRAWLEDRFAEGLSIKMVYEGKRSVAFVEYIPGEHAWRAVEAAGYMFIHCLWTVGKGKKKGYASLLLQACVEDARARGMAGVAMLTSSGTWLVDKPVLLKNGFELVESGPEPFDLVALRFGGAAPPRLPTDWEQRAAAFGAGLTICHTPQCPYMPDAVSHFEDAAGVRGIAHRTVEFASAKQVRDLAPSPFGVFSVVYDGKLLTYTWENARRMTKLLGPARHDPQ